MSLQPRSNPKIPEGINSTQDNPLREFAILFAGVTTTIVLATAILAYAIGQAAPHIPYSWERRIAPLIDSANQEPDAPIDERHAALQALGSELVAAMATLPGADPDIDTDIQSTDYHFHLVHNETPNAYATLGGHIFVTDALLSQLDSENGLAMVMAHEIAHVQYRHPVAAAGRGLILQLALSVGMGTAVGGFFGETLGSAGLYTILSFNRDMETGADAQALRIMAHHYGHLGGADEFFSKLHEEEDIEWLEFTRTHPNTERRLEAIQKAMAEESRGTGSAQQLIPITQRFARENK